MGKTLIERLSPEDVEKKYPNIQESRVPIVEKVAHKFRENYGEDNYIDWEKAAISENILYLEDSKTIIPSAFCKKRIILVHPCRFPYANTLYESTRAHEFGHIVLDHLHLGLTINSEEDEADYFSYNIFGTDSKRELSTFRGKSMIFMGVLRHPIMTCMCIANIKKYHEKLISENLQNKPSQNK